MSSRVLKKLQGGSGIELDLPKNDHTDGNQESDDDDEDISRGRGTHLNPFDLLNQNSPSESEVKEDDNETEHTSAANNLPHGSSTGGVSASKKKKKKRKKKAKYTGNPISSEDNELTDKYLSDIDSLVSGKMGNVSGAGSSNSALPTPPRIQIDKSLLCVELKHLNANNELRRTFGKRVVKQENKRGRQKLTFKNTYLVTGKETWPPLTKNIITMRQVMPPDNLDPTSVTNFMMNPHDKLQWFAFEHSKLYQNMQNLFLPAVERSDSSFLITLIRRCPYHVDSLIQLSELCKMTEDYSLASELIERAVLVLETSLHPAFSFTSGLCRLDYRRQENRAFFIVLFKHAQYLESRACTRTAFEIAKLIMTLNPEVDPLAMVLIIDYYALRSKEYEWLIKFYDEFDKIRNLSQLPNMAYSYALAQFCVNGECEKSDAVLQYALLMFPGVLRKLLEELGVHTDKRVQSCSYFNSGIHANQTPALYQLVCLYISRAKAVWRVHNVLPWLERNVNTALDRLEAKEEIIKDYIYKRNLRYLSPPRAILRHVYLADSKENLPIGTFLNREILTVYDPLPPLDSVNFYERKSSSSSPTTTQSHMSLLLRSLSPRFNAVEAAVADAGAIDVAAGGAPNAGGGPNAGGAPNAGGGPNAGVAGPAAVNPNPAEVALVNEQLVANGGDEAAIEHQLAINLDALNLDGENDDDRAGYVDLTNSLNGIVLAMRDFLQNFHIGDHIPELVVHHDRSDTEDSDDYYD